jgi:hypothetical protein
VAFDIGLLREIQIAAIGLRFTGKCGLQVFFGAGSFQIAHGDYLVAVGWRVCAGRLGG